MNTAMVEEAVTVSTAKNILHTKSYGPFAVQAAVQYLYLNADVLMGKPDPVVQAHAEARDWPALTRHLRARWGLPRQRFVPQVPSFLQLDQ